MEALDKEREARLNIERSETTLSEDLGRAQREIQSANQKVKWQYNSNSMKFFLLFIIVFFFSIITVFIDEFLQISSLNDMYKRLQDYITSLQQYNGKLHTELSTVEDDLKRVEKEKSTVMEDITMLRSQLTLSIVSLLSHVNFFNWNSSRPCKKQNKAFL